MIKIPNKFHVGGQCIDIQYPDRLDDKLGECCASAGYIKIANTFRGEIQSESSKRNTFIHEMIHCILDTMGESDLSANEKFVSTFAGFLMEIILSAENSESSIWHSKDEKPLPQKDIFIETIMDGYAVGSATYPWDSVKRWCYIKDIDK